MRISDWSSDVCSSDLYGGRPYRHVWLLFRNSLSGMVDLHTCNRSALKHRPRDLLDLCSPVWTVADGYPRIAILRRVRKPLLFDEMENFLAIRLPTQIGRAHV